MITDNLKELKNLIQMYKEKGIRYGKSRDFLLKRINAGENEIKEEIFNLNNLEHIEKQNKKEEIRYVLFFVYSNKKGRQYVVAFKDKMVIITAFPLGRKTLMKYRKKRFI